MRTRLERGAPAVQRYVGMLEEQIERLNGHITALLEFARPPALCLTEVDVVPLLEAVLEERTPPQRVRLRRRWTRPRPIRADPHRLRSAFGMLITNAYQAMPQGGQLTVAVRGIRDGLLVRITDTGQGIPPDQTERIFRPLTSTRPFGLGLGLPAARAIVEGHGGILTLESEVGRGTTVAVRLPRRPPVPEVPPG